MKIQKVEVGSDSPIHCVFCGQRILSMAVEDAEARENITPCPHTLFVCHDDGFEYRSAKFDAAMGISGINDEDIDTGGSLGWDGFTDKLEMPFSIKVTSYAPAPSGLGVYVGLRDS